MYRQFVSTGIHSMRLPLRGEHLNKVVYVHQTKGRYSWTAADKGGALLQRRQMLQRSLSMLELASRAEHVQVLSCQAGSMMSIPVF